MKPRRADDATRIMLVALSRLIDWRRVLTAEMATASRTWGEERITAELLRARLAKAPAAAFAEPQILKRAPAR